MNMGIEDPADKHHYITTVSGINVGSPGFFQPRDVSITDIARSLSMTVRFHGHLDVFYSVAEHSVLCAKMARYLGFGDVTEKCALLHDAHEAYTGDVARPNKKMIGDGWRDFEADRETIVHERFDLPSLYDTVWSEVKYLDDILLHAELLCLRSQRPDWFDPEIAGRVPFTLQPEGLPWQEAEYEFLEYCKMFGLT